jgi:hypothetical protein
MPSFTYAGATRIVKLSDKDIENIWNVKEFIHEIKGGDIRYSTRNQAQK